MNLQQQREFDPAQQPEINPFADLGRWAGYAERILEKRDDLALVANIRSSQRRKLLETGIQTVAALAAADGIHVPRFNHATLDRLRRQAKLQVSSRGKDKPDFELLPAEGLEGPLGLSLLPPASDGDIYFDMEGYPLIDEGREYLFGACFRENGALAFRDWWAHDRQAEKKALEGFVTWAYQRWQQFPDLHIYHYNHYEVKALRRLMGKYGVCEDEVDGMLRGGVFVDLYKVVRLGLLVGEPSYSLKYVEHLYRGHREGDVATAGESMVFYQRWLVARDGDTPATSTILKQIRDYNEQDCRSTAELAEWLCERQHEAGIAQRSPAGMDSAKILERYKNRLMLADYKDAKRGAGNFLQNIYDLGDGDVDFPACHRVLKSAAFKNWLIVDLDVARKGPRVSYERCGAYVVSTLESIYV
jgi:uncharacterized protein